MGQNYVGNALEDRNKGCAPEGQTSRQAVKEAAAERAYSPARFFFSGKREEERFSDWILFLLGMMELFVTQSFYEDAAIQNGAYRSARHSQYTNHF